MFGAGTLLVGIVLVREYLKQSSYYIQHEGDRCCCNKRVAVSFSALVLWIQKGAVREDHHGLCREHNLPGSTVAELQLHKNASCNTSLGEP